MFTGFYLFAIWNIFRPITIVLIWVEIEVFGALHFKCCPIITLLIFSMKRKSINDLLWPQVTPLKTFLIEFCTFWMLIKSIRFIGAKVSISNTRRHCRCSCWSCHNCSWSGRYRFMRCGGRTIASFWINRNIGTSIKLLLWPKAKTRSIFIWSPTVSWNYFYESVKIVSRCERTCVVSPLQNTMFAF